MRIMRTHTVQQSVVLTTQTTFEKYKNHVRTSRALYQTIGILCYRMSNEDSDLHEEAIKPLKLMQIKAHNQFTS